MALKVIDHFDGSFTLDPEVKATLFTLLMAESFLAQVAAEMACDRVEFTELLFQPVPYSAATPKGMSAEFEPYYTSAEHSIINVPPTFMFQAKIAKPARLCAIYRKVS